MADNLNMEMVHAGTMDVPLRCKFNNTEGNYPGTFGWSTFPHCCGVATIYGLGHIRAASAAVADEILTGIKKRLTNHYGMATAVIVTGYKDGFGRINQTGNAAAFIRNGWVAVHSAINPNSKNEITLFVLDLTK